MFFPIYSLVDKIPSAFSLDSAFLGIPVFKFASTMFFRFRYF